MIGAAESGGEDAPRFGPRPGLAAVGAGTVAGMADGVRLASLAPSVATSTVDSSSATPASSWSAGVAGGNLIPLFLRYSSSDRHTNSERKCPHSLGLILEKMKSISDAVNEVGRTLTASTNRYTFGRLSEALLGGVSLSTGLGSYPMA